MISPPAGTVLIGRDSEVEAIVDAIAAGLLSSAMDKLGVDSRTRIAAEVTA